MDTILESRGSKSRKTFWILALAYFLLATPSCSLKGAVKKCSFKVHKVAIKDFSNQGFKAVVTFKIKNPNWFGLKIKQLEYFIFVNDEELGTGKSESIISISRRSKSYVDIPLLLSLCALDRLLMTHQMENVLDQHYNQL